jgi:hypothetical protein
MLPLALQPRLQAYLSPPAMLNAQLPLLRATRNWRETSTQELEALL